MATVGCTKDIIEKIVSWKVKDNALDEGDRQLKSLVNIVCMDE
jgi:hypothetical protein